MPTPERSAIRMRIRGLVQGVGFRPAICRLAAEYALAGWVCNDGDGVLIHVEATPSALDAFRRILPDAIPPGARVESIEETLSDIEECSSFRIRVNAGNSSNRISARVPTDLAICATCARDVLDPESRRYRHAFASCTECGPRYSIIRRLPYDRRDTSMADFGMCSACAMEYAAPNDRRFHAETIACPDCGPHLSAALLTCADALRQGRIVALKGIGGYQLLVRADSAGAITRLRQRKQRLAKPFAVMVESLEDARQIAIITPTEAELLCGPENPIVFLESRKTLPDAIAPGLRHLGIMLPTTPIHLLLLRELDFPIIATSGNRIEEPIAIDDAGREKLVDIADVFLDHHRSIVRRVDDSVMRVTNGRPMTLRLGRGLAPCALPHLETWTEDKSPAPTLALGGQQKCALALWTGSQAILGQHLGDMDNAESRIAFEVAIADLNRLYGCQPGSFACDLHPDYFTSRWARSTGLPMIPVQHHHAHAVATMVEHGLLDETVLAVIFDGTGFGDDGTIWGGEILQTSASGFQRIASLDLFALPGGETAIHEPNRIAFSLLSAAYDEEIPVWLVDRLSLSSTQCQTFFRMIERGVNAPLTSSMGRLFDGVAALLLRTGKISYEGEAAMRLESIVDTSEEGSYPFPIHVDDFGVARGSWRPLIRELVEDIASDVSAGVCASRFHRALAERTADIAAASALDRVVLGGGCFQNAVLTTRVRTALEARGKKVYVPGCIPPNDGGLAVGQLAIAMAVQEHAAHATVAGACLQSGVR